ncbi:MAG TPA: hypothetical protein VM144_11525 [Aestuariivirga sp.]|nr:hypothetical protein [Aestuariivirga sp.]
MTRRNLILIHPGREYENDFEEIANKVFALDEDITTYISPPGLGDQLPNEAWKNPTLVVAILPDFRLRIERGTVLRNRPISKILQAKTMQEADVPTPPVLPLQFGMNLDPALFGEFVMIKPMNLRLTSSGKGIQVFRRKRLEHLKITDFPTDHLIHKDRQGYLVQKFINTGKHASTFRISTFLGRVMYSMKYQSLDPSPDLSDADSVIENGNFTQKANRENLLDSSPEPIALAKRVAEVFSDIPLLAIDIVVEEGSGKMYVLEVNAGGNSWHFSSKMWAKRRAEYPELMREMKLQYSAFDTAAQVLVEKTHHLAS